MSISDEEVKQLRLSVPSKMKRVDLNALLGHGQRNMTSELIALSDNFEVGRIVRNRKGKLSLVYDEGWREDSNAYPISLSMPLTAKEHGNEKIDSFLWGLLPDNQRILKSGPAGFECPQGTHSHS